MTADWCRDECSEDNGGCQHTCLNTPGGHGCGCWDGFTLADDDLSCRPATIAETAEPAYRLELETKVHEVFTINESNMPTNPPVLYDHCVGDPISCLLTVC